MGIISRIKSALSSKKESQGSVYVKPSEVQLGTGWSGKNVAVPEASVGTTSGIRVSAGTTTASNIISTGGGGSSGTTSKVILSSAGKEQVEIPKDVPVVAPSVQTGDTNIVPTINTQIAKQSTSRIVQGRFFDNPFLYAKTGIRNISVGRKNAKNKLIEEESMALRGGVRKTAGTGTGGRGTIMTQNIPYTDEEIVKLAGEGTITEAAALNELSRRENLRYGSERNFYLSSIIPTIVNDAKTEYQATYNNLNAQVQSGQISIDEANQILSSEADRINSNIQKRFEDSAREWSESRGQEMEKQSYVFLNKVSDRIKLKKTLMFAPEIVGLGALTGVAGAGIAAAGSVGAVAVGVTGYAGGAAALGITGYSLIKSYKEGTLNAGRIASVILPQLLFLGGAYGGAKVTGRVISNQNQLKLNDALSRAKTEITSTTAITEEAQIKALKIPAAEKENLIRELKLGNRVSVTEYAIKGTTEGDTKTLNKLLPSTKIKFAEVVNTAGNQKGFVVNRIAVGEIQVGTGKTAYRENILQRGEGFNVGKDVLMETIGLRVPEGKLPSEVSKSAQIIKPRVKYYMEEGQLKRVAGAESYSFEGRKITAQKGKPITYKDLMEVARSEYYKRVPSTQSKIVEIQRATSAKELNTAVSSGEKAIGFDAKSIKFVTEEAKGYSQRYLKPVEFERVPSSKKIKGFDVTEDINFKNLEKPKGKGEKTSGKGKQILEQLNKQESDLSLFPTFTKQVTESVKTGVQQLKQTENALFPLTKQKNKITQRDLDRTLQKIESLSVKSILKSKGAGAAAVINAQAPLQLQTPKQRQPQLMTPAQIEQQIQKLKQQSAISGITTPETIFKTPKIPEMPFPFLLPSYSASGQNKEIKFLTKKRKAESKYTASLAAAAFQSKPIKVTKKEYERLSKKIYTGAETRPVLEIIDEDAKKTARKIKTAVNF